MLVFSPKLERGFAGVPVISPLWDVLKLPQLGCWHLCYLNRGGTQQSHRRYWLCLTDIPMLCPPALLWAEMKPPRAPCAPPASLTAPALLAGAAGGSSPSKSPSFFQPCFSGCFSPSCSPLSNPPTNFCWPPPVLQGPGELLGFKRSSCPQGGDAPLGRCLGSPRIWGRG